MRADKKIEGYWHEEPYRNEPNDGLPLPLPNVLTDSEASEIFVLITKKQDLAKRNLYRGFSHSRITGERLGCAEYETDEWRWPGDFAKHYVLDHKVRPTDDFLKYIGYDVSTYEHMRVVSAKINGNRFPGTVTADELTNALNRFQ